MTVEDIEEAILRLPPAELAKFRAWFAEFEAGRVKKKRAPGHSKPAGPHRRSYVRGPSETLARAVDSLGGTEGAGRAVPAEFAQINCIFPRVVTDQPRQGNQ